MAAFTAPERDELTSERTRTARTILVEAALLGVWADVTLRNAPDGLGWTLWVISLVLAALTVARRRGLAVTGEQLAWLGIAVVFAGALAWRDAEELRFFNVLGTLVALAMFSMAAVGLPATSILVARIRDVVLGGVFTVLDIIAGAPMLVARDADLLSLPAVRGAASFTVLRAVLITIPVALVFTVLLSRADPVFASVFRLPELDVEVLVSHVFVIGAFAWWSAGYVRGALLGVSRRGRLPDRLPLRLGLAEVTASLGVVNMLFAFFVALQLRWLFGGADVVLATTGLTVAEYARRGFFELVGVAALVLPLILVTGAVIEDEKVVRRHRALSLSLIILVSAIIASAMLRMKLYIDYFGLTTDRLYATAIMVWLGMVALSMARTVLGGWSRPFAAMAVLSGVATLLALNAINPERLVARVNLGRSAAERGVDYAYLARLTGDAMPDVVNALKVATPSEASCLPARSLRERWLKRDASWNLGAQRGRSAVMVHLSDADVQRLCVGVAATDAAAKPTIPQ
jgi:hypothetical protein